MTVLEESRESEERLTVSDQQAQAFCLVALERCRELLEQDDVATQEQAMDRATRCLTVRTIVKAYENEPEVRVVRGYDFADCHAKDRLNQYFKEISKVPLLDREQEVNLWQRLTQGVVVQRAVWQRGQAARPTEDERAAIVDGVVAYHKFFNANLRLVVSIAKKFQSRQHRLRLDDLIQEGNLGLGRAIEDFDASKGNKFSTYATWWIRQAVQRGISEKGHTVRMPEQAYQDLFRLRKLYSDHNLQLGRNPTPEELQEKGFKPAQIRRLNQLHRTLFMIGWLDEPIGEQGLTELERLKEQPEDIEAAQRPEVHRRALTDFVQTVGLSDKEQLVLAMRRGVELYDLKPEVLEVDAESVSQALERAYATGGLTYVEIGQLLGVSREGARQKGEAAERKIQNHRAIMKLRSRLHLDSVEIRDLIDHFNATHSERTPEQLETLGLINELLPAELEAAINKIVSELKFKENAEQKRASIRSALNVRFGREPHRHVLHRLRAEGANPIPFMNAVTDILVELSGINPIEYDD